MYLYFVLFCLCIFIIICFINNNVEPYARLDIFCCCNQTSFSSIFLRDLHLPRVLRPDSLMGTVKGEGRRGRYLRVKVAVGFKYS